MYVKTYFVQQFQLHTFCRWLFLMRPIIFITSKNNFSLRFYVMSPSQCKFIPRNIVLTANIIETKSQIFDMKLHAC